MSIFISAHTATTTWLYKSRSSNLLILRLDITFVLERTIIHLILWLFISKSISLSFPFCFDFINILQRKGGKIKYISSKEQNLSWFYQSLRKRHLGENPFFLWILHYHFFFVSFLGSSNARLLGLLKVRKSYFIRVDLF